MSKLEAADNSLMDRPAELMRGASESLAGRVNFIHMGGLNCGEAGTDSRNRLWLRGGFPESYLAPFDEVSGRWRRSFIVERGGRRYGFERSVTEKPGVTHSMTIAKEDLGLDMVYLIYPGGLSFSLRDGMEAPGYARIPEFRFP